MLVRCPMTLSKSCSCNQSGFRLTHSRPSGARAMVRNQSASLEVELPGLPRLRRLAGIGVVWGVAVSAIGTSFIVGGLAAGWISHFPATDWTHWVTLVARVAARNFVLGGVSGAAFAMLLAGAERRRNVDSLSL